MAYFHTCRVCAHGKVECPTRGALQKALSGLKVSSVKHRCAEFRPVFEPGQPVEVLTVAWTTARHDDWQEDEPPRHWYPAHFIQMASTGPVVFVAPGSAPVDGDTDHVFEPRGQGFVRAALYRVRPRSGDAIDVTECIQCGAIPTLGQRCGFDRYAFHTEGKCRARQLELPPAPEPEPEPPPYAPAYAEDLADDELPF